MITMCLGIINWDLFLRLPDVDVVNCFVYEE